MLTVIALLLTNPPQLPPHPREIAAVEDYCATLATNPDRRPKDPYALLLWLRLRPVADRLHRRVLKQCRKHAVLSMGITGGEDAVAKLVKLAQGRLGNDFTLGPEFDAANAIGALGLLAANTDSIPARDAALRFLAECSWPGFWDQSGPDWSYQNARGWAIQCVWALALSRNIGARNYLVALSGHEPIGYLIQGEAAYAIETWDETMKRPQPPTKWPRTLKGNCDRDMTRYVIH